MSEVTREGKMICEHCGETIVSRWFHIGAGIKNHDAEPSVASPSVSVETSASQINPLTTRFDEFDDIAHPFNQWWARYGQYMMSGGNRRAFIWACRGWIAHEQLAAGVQVTGESLNEPQPEAAPLSGEGGEPKQLLCKAALPTDGFVPDLCGLLFGHTGEHKYIEAAVAAQGQKDAPGDLQIKILNFVRACCWVDSASDFEELRKDAKALTSELESVRVGGSPARSVEAQDYPTPISEDCLNALNCLVKENQYQTVTKAVLKTVIDVIRPRLKELERRAALPGSLPTTSLDEISEYLDECGIPAFEPLQPNEAPLMYTMLERVKMLRGSLPSPAPQPEEREKELQDKLTKCRLGIEWRDDVLGDWCDSINDKRLADRREQIQKLAFDKANDMWGKEEHGLDLTPYSEEVLFKSDGYNYMDKRLHEELDKLGAPKIGGSYARLWALIKQLKESGPSQPREGTRAKDQAQRHAFPFQSQRCEELVHERRPGTDRCYCGKESFAAPSDIGRTAPLTVPYMLNEEQAKVFAQSPVFNPGVAPAQAQPERPYSDGLYERLKDRKYAIEYLKACLDNGAFESALEDVLRASDPQKGQGWTRVEDGLPDEKRERTQNDVQVTDGTSIWDRPLFSMLKRELIPSFITHWREMPPLPAPPTVPAGPPGDEK